MKTKILKTALAASLIVMIMACTSKSKKEGASDSDSLMMTDTSGVMMDTTSTMGPDTAMKDTAGANMRGDTASMAPKP